MWGRSINVSQEVDVNFEYEVDIYEILELIEKCTNEEKKKIINTIEFSEEDANKKPKRKTLSVSDYVDVDFECDVDFSDILDLVENCSRIEKNLILETIDGDMEETSIIANNLYDEEKVKLLKCAFRKYDLDELMSRLDIKRNEF